MTSSSSNSLNILVNFQVYLHLFPEWHNFFTLQLLFFFKFKLLVHWKHPCHHEMNKYINKETRV